MKSTFFPSFYREFSFRLTNEQNHILDELDKIVHDEKFAVSYDLQKFDMTFFNNHRIIHGRTSFEDFADFDKKRYMVRSWIKNIPN